MGEWGESVVDSWHLEPVDCMGWANEDSHVNLCAVSRYRFILMVCKLIGDAIDGLGGVLSKY